MDLYQEFAEELGIAFLIWKAMYHSRVTQTYVFRDSEISCNSLGGGGGGGGGGGEGGTRQLCWISGFSAIKILDPCRK